MPCTPCICFIRRRAANEVYKVARKRLHITSVTMSLRRRTARHARAGRPVRPRAAGGAGRRPGTKAFTGLAATLWADLRPLVGTFSQNAGPACTTLCIWADSVRSSPGLLRAAALPDVRQARPVARRPGHRPALGQGADEPWAVEPLRRRFVYFV
jgi:hypothetical protein